MKQHPYSGDESLWLDFQSGSELALTQLMDQYIEPMTYYGRKLSRNDDLIQDCIQETFIEIWQYRQSLKALQEIRPYLLTCLRRKIGKAIKKDNHISLEENPPTLTFELDFSIEDRLVKNEEETQRLQELNRHINSLSKRRKEIIYLKFYQNLSNEEIAQIMGVRYQTATNLLHEAISSLRELIPSKSILSLLYTWGYLFAH
ncbi:RNA polymerase sigma factor (sigma-70 family) [Dyadobacter jejuensis]|uniref:RNA polymerase sigma factor (Sigma-70 family) n=1 Tax=Dyadobacter jejuensis TaxID=1082580 RepID=A0A316APW9_9BACT|nr:sigma-70 family RNA polymerase sigma factor [Dyadobacter jejuensis]PWJ59174.1 RNA polymerase sigma factor (sigma-70 family) [Dyadobacter jejuensis]